MKLLIKTPADLQVERETRKRDDARREAQDFSCMNRLDGGQTRGNRRAHPR